MRGGIEQSQRKWRVDVSVSNFVWWTTEIWIIITIYCYLVIRWYFRMAILSCLTQILTSLIRSGHLRIHIVPADCECYCTSLALYRLTVVSHFATPLILKLESFWDMTLCRLFTVWWLFGGALCIVRLQPVVVSKYLTTDTASYLRRLEFSYRCEIFKYCFFSLFSQHYWQVKFKWKDKYRVMIL